MISRRFFRNLLLPGLLGIALAAIMVSIFFLQYRTLAADVTAAGAERHHSMLADRFVADAGARLRAIATELAAADALDAGGLNSALAADNEINGLRFTTGDGRTLQVGSLPAGPVDGDTEWLPELLLVTTPVVRDDAPAGMLTAGFSLDGVSRTQAAFTRQVERQVAESRRDSYLQIGLGMLATLLVGGVAFWLMSRSYNSRIDALRRQALKLGDADFGEPLPTDGDALGDLARVFNDMRDRLRATTMSRDYVDSILSGMNDAIIVTAHDGTIKRINKASIHLLGYEEDELLGTSIDFVVNTRKSGSLLDKQPSGVPRDAFFESKFGESIPVSYTCSVLEGRDDEAADRIYAAQNITERRRAEKRIRYLARTDALTKIPNRMQFQHLLQRGIARARRRKDSLCLFYVDIDKFKEINDTFGHLAGDTTLETVAERLAAALPENSVIGRLAGDEFAVIVDGLGPGGADRAQTSKLAQSILNRLADPFFVQGHEVFMTASMGIAYYPDDAPNVIDLIRNADAALYAAKKAGGNVYAYYQPQMNEAAVERLMTKSKLKRAFERDELLVHYQPKYNLDTGEVFGAEALVRWELPERGLILPSDFIPIAEETSLIIEIGEWVLDKVCEDFRFWQRSVPSPGRVSVNLSLKQLRQANFINRIGAILRSYELSPTSLELEITETTLMENPERTIKLLDQLYALGLHLAIDDFGTGYSSLSALQQFPISTLKIDQSFVRDAANNPDDATIVGTIVQMGRNLNMDVVAEGVESEEQLAFLQRVGCNYVQGLLFGDPMSSDNYLELLLAQAEGTDTHRALFG